MRRHRGQVRSALRATLIKRQEDTETFERALRRPHRARSTTPHRSGRTPPRVPARPPRLRRRTGTPATTNLLEDLVAALRDDDADALRALATISVDRFGATGVTSQDSERAILYRVLRGLDLARILQRALRERAEQR